MERAKARKLRKRARRRSDKSFGSTSVPAIALPTIEHEASTRRDLSELLQMLRTLATSENEVVRSARWCIAAVFCGICVALLGVAVTSPREPARRVASFEYAAHAANDASIAMAEAPFAFPTTGLPPGAIAASANVRAVSPPPAIAAPPPKVVAPKRVIARPVAKPARPATRPR